jgi:hypothetical protein
MWVTVVGARCMYGSIYIYGVCTVFLAGKLPNKQPYKMYIHGSGQPYKRVKPPLMDLVRQA